MIEDLLAILPLPSQPVGTCLPAEWCDLEKRLGITFPSDYKQFISQYGAGAFFDFLGINSPFTTNSNLLKGHEFLRGLHEAGQIDEPKLFPDAGGLLLLGGDENGNMLFWRTRNGPDAWTIVYTSEEFLDFEEFDMSLTSFLAGWISGRIRPKLIEDLKVLQRSAPVFSPYRFS
jgi:hypothetical protein